VQGEYSVVWDGTDANGVRVPSGIYFARAKTAAGSVVTRMVLIR
jgi:FlgD Ig-like domain